MNHDPRLHLDGHVIVWLARLSEWQPVLSHLESLLDARERERAGRFHFAEDRARFVMGRGLVRTLAAPYLLATPGGIEIGYTDRDRPVFARERKTQFSIAHSGEFVAVALTAHGRVGVDVEFMRPDLKPEELASRVFSEAAQRAFLRLPEPERHPAFFRNWTRKEAYLKARGEGITDALQHVNVLIGEAESCNVHDARDPSAHGSWLLRALPIGAEYAGCVAYEGLHKRGEVSWVRMRGGEVETKRDERASW